MLMDAEIQVLLVENSQDNAAVISQNLGSGGVLYKGRRVETEAEMIAALEEQSWDIIIAEYSLPFFGGLDVLRVLRERKRDVPVIIVSEVVDEEHAAAVMKAGAGDYVHKAGMARLAPAMLREIRYLRYRRECESGAKQARRDLEERVEQRTCELAAANAMLRAAEIEFRAAFETSGIGKAHCDFNTGRFLRVNEKLAEITGYDCDELLAMDFEQLVHPDDRPHHQEMVRQMISEGSSQYNQEQRFLGKDGRVVWAHVTAMVVRAETDGPTRVYMVIENITQRKNTEAELNANAERLRHAIASAEATTRAKSQFLANMSHEIRAPMTAIMGYAELLLEPEQSDDQRKDRINVIQKNGEHLLMLINDILDLSKIEAGEMQVERLPCSPARILNDVLSIMRVRAAEKALQLEVSIEGKIPETISSDPTRLKQILLNLVDNAIKFTDAGCVRIVVRFDQTKGHPHICFEVSDTGPGIDEGTIKRLFLPFTQLDASTTRRFGGTGLGLAITQQLANMLGGEVRVRSVVNGGSTFIAEVATGDMAGVALIDGPLESICHDEPLAHPDQPLPILHGRILLAEDDRDNQQLLAHYLRRAGAEVMIADDGQAACDAMRRSTQPFDLVLMDIQMPKLDGYAATSQLRREGYKMPIIALTAHAMAEDREKCLAAGYTDHLPKPLLRAQLLIAVAAYLSDALKHVPEPTIHSVLEDEDVRPYFEEFCMRLPSVVDQIQTKLTNQDIAGLQAIIHTLKGTGGLYGFPQITQAARLVEESMDMSPPGNLDIRVQNLLSVIRSIDVYPANRAA
jgi:PAS domain S-box-containing protein